VDTAATASEWGFEGFVDTEFSTAAVRYFYREDDEYGIGRGGFATVKE
jgi:hypothetical protein